MKFTGTLNGSGAQEFRLYFRHVNSGSQRSTEALIKLNAPSPTPTQPLKTATCRCSLHDKFNKETGRKLALTRLLAGFEKPFRTAAWEAYNARKPTGAHAAAAL